jgi:hypothetical protein
VLATVFSITFACAILASQLLHNSRNKALMVRWVECSRLCCVGCHSFTTYGCARFPREVSMCRYKRMFQRVIPDRCQHEAPTADGLNRELPLKTSSPGRFQKRSCLDCRRTHACRQRRAGPCTHWEALEVKYGNRPGHSRSQVGSASEMEVRGSYHPRRSHPPRRCQPRKLPRSGGRRAYRA